MQTSNVLLLGIACASLAANLVLDRVAGWLARLVARATVGRARRDDVGRPCPGSAVPR